MKLKQIVLYITLPIIFLFTLFYPPQQQILAAPITCVSISHNLAYGSKDSQMGNDVIRLQVFLTRQGYLSAIPTGNFGPATFAAVKIFQIKNGIATVGSAGYGKVGPLTRAKISNMSCGGPYTPSPVQQNPIVNPPMPVSACTNGALFNIYTGQRCSPIMSTYGKPTFDSMFNPHITIGSQLFFVVHATDPSNKVLKYSAKNLPQGAGFNPNSQAFYWTPNAIGTYSATFSAANDVTAVDQAVTIFVDPVSTTTAPRMSLTVLPPAIFTSQSSTLMWSSTNTNSCTASGGWSGSKALSGNETVQPNTTTTYILTCNGTGSSGSVSTSTTVTVQSNSVQNTSVVSVQNGNVTVGGTPFFPFGFYYIPSYGEIYRTLNEKISDLHLMANAGFNTLYTGYLTPDDFSSQLTEAQNSSIRIIGELVDHSQTPTIATQYKNNNGLLGWNIGDDIDVPRLSASDVLSLKNSISSLTQSLHSVDPNHITHVAGGRGTNQPSPNMGDFMNVSDVIGMGSYSIYPSVSEPTTYPRVGMYNIWNITKNARQFARPVIANVQAYKDYNSTRGPTPSEERNMTYQAVCAGVKGILYYTFYDHTMPGVSPVATNYLPVDHPELWTELKSLAPEINTLAPALLNGQFTNVHEPADSELYELCGSTWQYNGKTYVVALNASSVSPHDLSLDIPAGSGTRAAPLFNSFTPSMSLDNGVLHGTLQPLDVQVYVIQ